MQDKIDQLRRLPVPGQSLFIGGGWREAKSGATMDVTSPIDGSILTTIADAGTGTARRSPSIRRSTAR